MSYGRARGNAAWTFADQALSSLTNAALAIVVARSVDTWAFGAFSLALIIFSFVIGMARAIIGEPFVIRFAAAAPAGRLAGMRSATGTALTLGCVAGAAVAAVALLFHGRSESAMLALAVSLPGLVLQDAWRFVFFAQGRPKAAAINDLVWTLTQVVLMTAALHRQHTSVMDITLAWGASATLAAVVGCYQARAIPLPLSSWSWVKETRRTNLPLALGYAVNMSAVHGSTMAVGAVLGLPAVAALRAAQVLLGPLNLIFAAFNAYALPLYARRWAVGDRLVSLSAGGSLGLAGLATAWVGVLVFLPDSVGEALLRDNWEGADQVMLASGLVVIAGALVLGASNALMAMDRVDLSLRVTLVQAPLFLLGVTGAAWWGVEAAAYGFAVAQVIGLLLCWSMFLGQLPPFVARHRSPARMRMR